MSSRRVVESWRTIDKYELVEKLGEGGFGVVYKARHLVTRLPVAIKILITSAEANPDVVTRFRREASIGNLIDHENVVRALDFGDVMGQPYLVLEFLDGQSLDEAVRMHGPLAPTRAARVALQVADALAAAHAHGVIHRDLKPENIFLVHRGGREDLVKVLDFGIAKLTTEIGDALRTRSQVLIGSPMTMSPEQCRGAEVDERSDVYALGVVLFYAVTGRYPFTGPPGDILSGHMRDPPPRVREVRPGVPSALDLLVERALAKDPAARFQSMRELGASLAPLAADTTAAATVQLRRRDAPGRRRWPVALAIASGLAAATLGVWLARRSSRETRPAASADLPAPAPAPAPPTEASTALATVAAAPPALPVAARRERVGYLSVAVLPIADVTVDGRAAGATPLRNLPLRAGAHTIELSNTGLRRHARRIEQITPGGHCRIQLDWSE